jgi:hypothetical protein
VSIPTKPPSFSEKDWAAYMRFLWGDDYHAKDTVYEFNNRRRTFKDSGPESGIYEGTGS